MRQRLYIYKTMLDQVPPTVWWYEFSILVYQPSRVLTRFPYKRIRRATPRSWPQPNSHIGLTREELHIWDIIFLLKICKLKTVWSQFHVAWGNCKYFLLRNDIVGIYNIFEVMYTQLNHKYRQKNKVSTTKWRSMYENKLINTSYTF